MTTVTYEPVSYRTTRIMPSRRSNQHTDVTLVLHMDLVTFQAAVSDAVIVVMTQQSQGHQ